jgi:hypothetical protein
MSLIDVAPHFAFLIDYHCLKSKELTKAGMLALLGISVIPSYALPVEKCRPVSPIICAITTAAGISVVKAAVMARNCDDMF